MTIRLVNCDCMEFLYVMKPVKMIFADIPDNIGVQYEGYNDLIDERLYYNWVELLLRRVLGKCKLFWLSYSHRHDLEIKFLVRNIIKYDRPIWNVDTFLWRYTFSQYREVDCAYGYRPIMRLMRKDCEIYPGEIRELSERQKLGDKRAGGERENKERVPDNVWEYPRVVGNSKERRAWHPTQHPEALIQRICKLSLDKENDEFVDLFVGSGTSLRVAGLWGYNCTGVDLSEFYCKHIADDLRINVLTLPNYSRIMESTS